MRSRFKSKGQTLPTLIFLRFLRLTPRPPRRRTGAWGVSRSETRMQGNADQIRLPKRPFVGAPPRGEAFDG
ncbi:MAG: hypothetical protein E2579_20910 [Pseudomonas sp.]|nr:hypothetical protein [Pseudomonas sp.]WJH54751.1 hypothetical protein FE254_00765 [Pseudomonas guguanensis]